MPELCYHFKFILFVTGRGEKEHLPELFSAISKSGICTFIVKERVEQLRPIKSQRRIAEMVGSGKLIPDKDFEKIGAPARKYIRDDHCNRVILVDDLENINQSEAKETYDRYRKALDSGLGNERRRASVHFLVNMLEAYFFAHSDAINVALGLEPPIEDFDGDVETIRNPKSELKAVEPAYNEIDSAGKILERLELDIVLKEPDRCPSLRTCIKWIVDQLGAYPEQVHLEPLKFDERFHLQTGQLFEITSSQ